MLVEVTLPLPGMSTQALLTKLVSLCRIQPRLVGHDSDNVLPETLNTQEVALHLYQDYLLPFEIASLLLLVAIIGAVVMAKKRI